MHCASLHFTVLHCTAMHCTALNYTALHLLRKPFEVQFIVLSWTRALFGRSLDWLNWSSHDRLVRKGRTSTLAGSDLRANRESVKRFPLNSYSVYKNVKLVFELDKPWSREAGYVYCAIASLSLIINMYISVQCRALHGSVKHWIGKFSVQCSAGLQYGLYSSLQCSAQYFSAVQCYTVQCTVL